MNVIRASDELFQVLHKAGWSIGYTAFAGPEGLVWMVFGTQGGYEIHCEGATRGEAWKKASRQAEALGLIDTL